MTLTVCTHLNKTEEKKTDIDVSQKQTRWKKIRRSMWRYQDTPLFNICIIVPVQPAFIENSQPHAKNQPLKRNNEKKERNRVDMCCTDPIPACKEGNFQLFSFNNTEQVMFSIQLLPNLYPIGPVGTGKVGQ